MTLDIQGGGPADRLRRQFGLKGRIPVSLDEIVVPTADIGDYNGRSPYEDRVICGDYGEVAASGAGTYGYVAIAPGAGTTLVIESIMVGNVTGATHILRVGVWAATLPGTYISQRHPPSWNEPKFNAGAVRLASCLMTQGHHTAFTQTICGEFTVASNGLEVFPMPRGFIMNGDDPNLPIAFGVQTLSANAQTPRVNWVGVEYKNR